MVQTAAQAVETDRTAERKRQILEGAARVFRRRGLHATGMREIAAELDMHAGNLYYYFKNKQELLAFCQQDTLDSLLELADGVRSADLSAGGKLRQLIRGHVQRLNEEFPGSLAHLEVEALEPAWRSTLQERRDEYENVFVALIRQGVAAGEFRPADPGIAAKAILGALNWTVKWFRTDGQKSASQIGEEFSNLLVEGLARRAEPREPLS